MSYLTNLKNIIIDNLKDEISAKYALFDLPYHTNIGDALIWEGETLYLNDIKSRCEYKCSYFTSDFPQLDTATTILFHGGGNIGDLYREHIEFLIKIIKRYPQNKILIFPQTLYYQSNSMFLKEDIKSLSIHNNLIFCVRDNRSYNYLKGYIKNVKLMPDMAFYISEKDITPKTKRCKGTLLIKRKDRELKNDFKLNISNIETKDWPTFNKKLFDGTFIFKLLKKIALITNNKIAKKIVNMYADRARINLVQIGYDFINEYEGPIYSTRLHGCILSLLMNKKVVLIDNSYGKNIEFYNTWLKEYDRVQMYQTESNNPSNN